MTAGSLGSPKKYADFITRYIHIWLGASREEKEWYLKVL
jgi:hypothetical protein